MPPVAGGEPFAKLIDLPMSSLGYSSAISSTPGLAAALRQSHRRLELPGSFRSLLRGDPLVQMYRIPVGQGENAVAEEARAAAHVLLAVADRLRRLSSAYGEWRDFDASAYFDLSYPQTARLVRVVERVNSVHVTFFADLLLPAFQSAESFWLETYRSQYRMLRAQLRHGGEGGAPLETVMAFGDHCQPQMVEHWQRLVQVVEQTRCLLDDELGFWAANGGDEERARWRWVWQRPPAPGVAPALLPELQTIPTLTLAV
ncbi:MAG TPA: hypothetical protein VNK95_23305, partial [Caldilineaceae bacterium]|nr:hypothetical protein [Caldilineaceae bacterium]